MAKLLDPFRLLLTSLAGWMNQRHLQAIDYLREENRVLREQLGDRRLRLTDEQRRRLAGNLARLAPETDYPEVRLPEETRRVFAHEGGLRQNGSRLHPDALQPLHAA